MRGFLAAVLLTAFSVMLHVSTAYATDEMRCTSSELNSPRYLSYEDAADIVDDLDDDEWLTVVRADKSELRFRAYEDDDYVLAEAYSIVNTKKPAAEGRIGKKQARKALSEFYIGMPPSRLGI